jgi:hypothetical protein
MPVAHRSSLVRSGNSGEFPRHVHTSSRRVCGAHPTARRRAAFFGCKISRYAGHAYRQATRLDLSPQLSAATINRPMVDTHVALQLSPEMWTVKFSRERWHKHATMESTGSDYPAICFRSSHIAKSGIVFSRTQYALMVNNSVNLILKDEVILTITAKRFRPSTSR